MIGYRKGKSAMAEGHQFGGRKRNLNGKILRAWLYAVFSVGFELNQMRKYIGDQNERDNKEDGGNF